jgi:hypothetical protein
MSRRAASCLDSFGSGCFAIQASSDAMAAGSSYTTIAPVEGLVELEAAKRPLAQGVRPRHDHSKSLRSSFIALTPVRLQRQAVCVAREVPRVLALAA